MIREKRCWMIDGYAGSLVVYFFCSALLNAFEQKSPVWFFRKWPPLCRNLHDFYIFFRICNNFMESHKLAKLCWKICQNKILYVMQQFVWY